MKGFVIDTDKGIVKTIADHHQQVAAEIIRECRDVAKEDKIDISTLGNVVINVLMGAGNDNN